MNIYICLFFCCIPFLLCFISFKLFSSIKVSTELFASLFGLLAVLPITFLQYILSDVISENNLFILEGVFPLFMKALIYCGLIEEIIKMLFIACVPKKKISFNNFFMAALLFGLCIGCFESVVYFLRNLQQANVRGAELIYYLIFARIFSADLIHMFCAGLCGIFVWSCILKQYDFGALIFSILIHGVYDFFASFQSNIKWFSVVAILFVIIETRIHYEKNKPLEEYKKDPYPLKTNKDVTVESALKDTPAYNSSRKK